MGQEDKAKITTDPSSNISLQATNPTVPYGSTSQLTVPNTLNNNTKVTQLLVNTTSFTGVPSFHTMGLTGGNNTVNIQTMATNQQNKKISDI